MGSLKKAANYLVRGEPIQDALRKADSSSNIVNIVDKGADPNGVQDATTIIQNALDNAVSVYIPSGTYLVTGTIYVGNNILYGDGRDLSIINIQGDANWSELGTGDRKDQGAFISKAGTSAGYNLTSIIPVFKDLTIQNDRTNSAGPQSAILLEKTDGGGFYDISLVGVDTGTLDCTLFDLYAGVQNFTIKNCTFDNSNTTATTGGCWIRNFSATTWTRNVSVENCKFLQNSDDEALAVFNSASATGTEISNINIDGIEVINTGAGSCVAFLNNNDDPEFEFSGSLSNAKLEVSDLVTGTPVVKHDNCSCPCDNVVIVVQDCVSGNGQGFRHVNYAAGERPRPVLSNCSVIVDGTPTSQGLRAYMGHYDMNDCSSYGVNGGELETSLYYVAGKVNGGIHKSMTTYAMFGTRYVTDVRFELDYDTMSQAYPFTCNEADLEQFVFKDVFVEIVGTTNAITGILRVNPTSGSAYPAFVDNVYVNGTGAAIPATPNSDFNATYIKVVEFDNVIYNDGGTFYRETETIDI